MARVLLAGKPRELDEPVFKQLRRLISAYNTLASATSSDAERLAAVDALLDSLGTGLTYRRLRTGELEVLLAVVPDLCRLKPAPTGRAVDDDTAWGDVYSHLAACFGWDFDTIDNRMTLGRLDWCTRYWQRHPPVHQLVAAYLGYEAPNANHGSAFLAAIAAQADST